jgi:hypothetical protein
MLKKIYHDLSADPTPDNVQALSREFRTTTDKVEDFHETLHRNVQAGLVDDLPLYGDSALDAERMAADMFDGSMSGNEDEEDDELL